MHRHLELRHLAFAAGALLGLLPATLAAQPQTAPASQSTSQPAARLRLYVAQYDVGEQCPIEATTANDIVAARMGRLGEVFSLVTHEEVQKVLSHEALQQMLGNESSAETLINIGETIAADRLVAGRMHRVGETFVATLTLFDLRTGVVEKRVAGTFKGQADLAIARLNEQSDQMLAFLLLSYAPDKIQRDRAVAVKIGKPKPTKRAGGDWPALKMGGAALVGLGVGVAAGGGVSQALGVDDAYLWVPLSMYATGGLLAATGVALALLPSAE
ncbi:MAG: hypothetical protein JXR83_11455 [Deltaproteobacteria bacterium]|nr:hypothetical protein [Deltaproteobacteria bacterium]